VRVRWRIRRVRGGFAGRGGFPLFQVKQEAVCLRKGKEDGSGQARIDLGGWIAHSVGDYGRDDTSQWTDDG
jgi:hypothetical protein